MPTATTGTFDLMSREHSVRARKTKRAANAGGRIATKYNILFVK